MRRPSDQSARTEVAEHTAINHFVEAGAGTGKTDTLLKRVLGLVSRGVPMRSIAAITFTERAAEELRSRIRARLESGSGTAEALLEVDQAAIGTIHSFARRILADHGIAMGVPPGFSVVTTTATSSGNDEVWHAVTSRWRADSSQHLDALWVLGIRESALHPLVFGMLGARSRIDPESLPVFTGGSTRQAAVDLVQQIRAARARADAECTNRSDNFYAAIHGEKLDALLALATAIGDDTAPADAVRDLAHVADRASKFGNVGKAPNWGGAKQAENRKALAAGLVAGGAAVQAAASEPPIRALLTVAVEMIDAAQAKRIRSGELQFDDLLVACERLLREHQQVARHVAQTYQAILVDEFQDTDPLQWRIVQSITSVGRPDDRPRPGSLVLVGDPKQSIYSFRGADVHTYEQVRDVFSGQDQSRAELSVNFRTVEPVMNWINALFSTLFAQAGASQVRYDPLSAHHSPIHEQSGAPVLLLGGTDTTSFDEGASQVESELVVAAIGQAIAEQWQVTRGTDEYERVYYRPATYRDIAIVLPARNSLNLLLNELDRSSIPYRSVDAAIIFDRPITKGLIAALRAIAREDDGLALWAALKSPLFGLTDADLLAHTQREAFRGWRIPYQAHDLSDEALHPADAALDILYRARMTARLGRPVDVLRFLVAVCDVHAVLAQQERAPFELECLRLLLDQALAWQEAGGAGVEPFVSWLASASADLRSGLGLSDDLVADAVQISTVHGAKGLEFPIVILAGMATSPNGYRDPLLIDRTGRVEFVVTGAPKPRPLAPDSRPPEKVKWPSAGYPASAQRVAAEQAAELQRLLYVGMTRAQDHLIVSVVSAKKSSRAMVLKGCLPPAEVLLAGGGRPTSAPIRPTPTPGDPPIRDHLDVAAAVSAHLGLLRPSRDGQLAAALHIEVADPTWPAVLQGEQRGFGTEMGNAVHESLEAIMVHGPGSDLSSIAARGAKKWGGLDPQQVELRINAALTSATVREAMAGRRWPELAITYALRAEAGAGIDVIDGLVDLVYELGDDLVVADYKTDTNPSPKTQRHYAEQLAIYAVLLGDLTGRRVAKKVVVWLPPDGSVHDIEV